MVHWIHKGGTMLFDIASNELLPGDWCITPMNKFKTGWKFVVGKLYDLPPSKGKRKADYVLVYTRLEPEAAPERLGKTYMPSGKNNQIIKFPEDQVPPLIRAAIEQLVDNQPLFSCPTLYLHYEGEKFSGGGIIDCRGDEEREDVRNRRPIKV